MKIKILRSKFLDGMKYVQNIIGSKGSLSILQNVLIETLDNKIRMTTTDLDMSIMSEVECTVIESGNTTLPVKLLFSSIAKASEGEIEIDVDAMERATIVAGSAKFRLSGMPATDYPKLPVDENAFAYKLNQNLIKEMLRKVSYAASQDDTRRTLKGVLMRFKDNKLTMVAIDGRRLALVENEIEFPKDAERDIVLPSKAVAELQRSLNDDGDLYLSVQKTQISLKMESVKMYSKLIDDVYPNYEQVIPRETSEKIEVDRILLLNALERASVMTMDEAHSIKLIFDQGKLTVTSSVSDKGDAKDDVPIKYCGERIEILFNPVYVMDPLKVIDDDMITFHLNNDHSPAIIRCSIPFLYVLMPLRIN